MLIGYDEKFSGGVDNIEFVEDGGGVGGEDYFLEMVDDDFVVVIGI